MILLPDTRDLIKSIEQIVNDEFHEDCMISSAPTSSVSYARDYFLKKKPKALDDVKRTFLSNNM